jgi:hypothetical protein
MLLNRGATANNTALRLAAASEKTPLEGVIALLAHGARDDEALGWARRQGETSVVAALKSVGMKDTDAVPMTHPVPPARAPSPRVAVERSLRLLQKVDIVFLKKAGCVSCHNNSLTEMTLARAQRQGFHVDEAASRAQLVTIRAYLESWQERVLQDIAIPGGVDTAGYILAGLGDANYPPDPATHALARYLMRRQAANGGWRIGTQRPPIESSDFEASAIAIRALQVYAPRPQTAYASAIRKGATWLAQAVPKTTEDHVYQLLGLGWSGGSKEAVRKAARRLMALQRRDGGWAQLLSLSSDAYATGQALTALADACPYQKVRRASEKPSTAC